MLDVASRLADDKRNDIRIEAAIAKLYGSELGWQVVDELVQVRGGRGYETAESLKARGEKPVPVEQVLRDMRINRIFEGSTEIMHLLIAREAVDQHLQVAGDLLEAGTATSRTRRKRRCKAGEFYAKWLPQLAVGEGQKPGSFDEFGDARRAPALRRARLAQARALDLLRDGPLAGEARAASRRSSAGSSTSAPSCSRSPPPSSTPTRSGESSPSADEAVELADLFCQQARRRAETLFGELWANDDDANYAAAQHVLEGRYTWLEEGIVDPSGDGPMIPPQPGDAAS